MHKLVIFTDPGSALGFRLAGVETIEASSSDEVRGRFEVLLNDPETGIIGMNEQFFDLLDIRTRQKIDKISRPVVVPIPALEKMGEIDSKRLMLQKIIKKAVGFDIKMGS